MHNGIEFGMLQAMAEGFDLLTHYHDRLDIASVLECWRHGSVIRSWLLDLLTQAYREDEGADLTRAVFLALHLNPGVAARTGHDLIGDQQKNWARAIVLMRHAFGGHPFGPDAATAHERHVGRVGDCLNPNIVEELGRAD